MPITGLTFSGVPIGESGYNPWSPSSNFGSGSDLSQEELYKRAQEELLNNSNQYPDVENITSPYDSQMAGLTQQQLDAQKQLSQPESKTSKVTNGIMGLLSAIAMIRDMTNKSRSVRARAPQNVMAGMDVMKQAKEEAQRKKQDEYTRTMQAIQAQKEDVQNSIRTAMSKAELKSANTARKAQALNAVEKPAQPKLPTAEEAKTKRLQDGYDALVKGYPGATGKQLAAIAYEKYPEIFKEYFSKDYPQEDDRQSHFEFTQKFLPYYKDFYNEAITKGKTPSEATVEAQTKIEQMMVPFFPKGPYQPPAPDYVPPSQRRNSFNPNDFQFNPFEGWSKNRDLRSAQNERMGGVPYDQFIQQLEINRQTPATFPKRMP